MRKRCKHTCLAMFLERGKDRRFLMSRFFIYFDIDASPATHLMLQSKRLMVLNKRVIIEGSKTYSVAKSKQIR